MGGIGSLKTCQSGNRFILTVIDFPPHYPLAYPLKSHTAMDVVKCLVELFSHCGFPDELHSDCGTEFLGRITQAFLVECYIGQIKISHYDPQSNGCLERFHRTLKSTLKGCREKYSGDWDTLLPWPPWVMFANREAPVEGFGYSPFQLLFCRNVKNILQLFKKAWLKDNLLGHVKSTNIIYFVLFLRDRIRTSVEIANQMEEKAKKKGKFGKTGSPGMCRMKLVSKY